MGRIVAALDDEAGLGAINIVAVVESVVHQGFDWLAVVGVRLSNNWKVIDPTIPAVDVELHALVRLRHDDRRDLGRVRMCVTAKLTVWPLTGSLPFRATMAECRPAG